MQRTYLQVQDLHYCKIKVTLYTICDILHPEILVELNDEKHITAK